MFWPLIIALLYACILRVEGNSRRACILYGLAAGAVVLVLELGMIAL